MSGPSSNHSSANRTSRELVGLIPAGGAAERLQPLPCSKELYPVGFRWSDDPTRFHPKPVCVHLLERMRTAGVEKAYMILRRGKWDIPAYLADGSLLNLHLGYLIVDLPYGVPFTLDQAYPFVQDTTIVFGFPDILFHPEDAFAKLLARMETSAAAVVLGLFPVSAPGSMDMVELDDDGQIHHIHIKPRNTTLTYTWIIATWTPAFTRFLHAQVAAMRKAYAGDENKAEVCFSDVINAAIKNHVRVDHVIFDDGDWLDIGSPDRLERALMLAHEGLWSGSIQGHEDIPERHSTGKRHRLPHP